MANKLFQTTTVRLALGYTALFVVAGLILFGVIYVNTTALLVQQTDETIAAEIQGLSEQYADGGITQLVRTVRERSRRPGDGLYFVGDGFGRYLVGNLDGIPEAEPSEDGWIDFDIARTDDIGSPAMQRQRHGARARLFTLAEGAVLLVGRDIQARKDIEAVVERALIWGLVATVVLGIGGGLLAGRRMLRRVDDASGVARDIITGDLTRRLPLAGTNDELDRLSATLNQMLDRIERLMSGMRDVTDNIAHDLRTPLTRVRARAENAANTGTMDDDTRAALDDVIGEADRLLATISALLSIARLEAGSGHDGFQPINLSALLDDLADLYRPAAEEAGFDLSSEFASDVEVSADRQLLSQAIVNLIENALKYGRGADRNNLDLGLERDGNRILITVADHGPGIPADKRAVVLDRFKRLDQTRSGGGSGLGLSLVRAIIEAHGGAIILIDNKPGLRATLSLPAPR